jgi:hypothetical protein
MKVEILIPSSLKRRSFFLHFVSIYRFDLEKENSKDLYKSDRRLCIQVEGAMNG